MIWNPDGSTAELSGNGTRIAARWLARRSGEDEVAIRVGPREVVGAHARRSRGRDGRWAPSRWGRGRRSAVGDERSSSRRSRSATRTRSSARGARAARTCCGSARSSRTTSASRSARTSSSCGSTGRTTSTVGVWERGRGRRSPPGTSSVAAAAAAVANGWCESPVTVHLAGGDLLVELQAGRPSRRPRAGDLPRRAVRGIRAVRFSKRLDQVPPYLFAELERKISAEARPRGST